MDSTSGLFSRLDLSTSSPPEGMDIVDKETDIIEESNDPLLNPRRGSTRNAHTGNNDIEQQRRRERLMQLINDTLETECSSNAQDEVLECEQDEVFNGAAKRTVFNHRRHKGSWRKKGKEQFPVFDGGNFVVESKVKRGGFVSGRGPFQHDVPWEDQGQRGVGHHGYIAPHNSARGRISSDAGHVCGQGVSDIVDGETHSPFTKISHKDKMIEVDSPSVSRHETGQRHQRWSNFDPLPKNTGSGWHVQNESTSHYNKTQAKNTVKDYGFGTMMHGDLLEGNLSRQHIASPDCEGRHPDRKEGKMILVDDIFRGGLNINSELSSDRHDDDAFISPDDVAGRSYDHRSKSPLLPSEDSNSISKIEEGTSVHLSDPRPKNTLERRNYFNLVDDSLDIKTSHRLNQSVVQVPSELENGSSRGDRRRQQFSKGKRKCNSFYSNYGGSSSSAFENSETSYHQSSMHLRYNMPSMTDYQRRDEIFDPVMEVDEPQSPEERFNCFQEQTIILPDNSNARTSQIESDEILARQLQEQFYDEVAGSAVTEEEQEESMAHLHAYYSQLPYRNSSTRCSNHAQSLSSNRRRNFYGSEIDLESRMMAEVRNFTGMDPGMRRDFLEVLEAAFDQRNDALAESQHDFNENDYDMLLALDENNLHCAGASESQINSLPQSVVQSDNVEEACAICLENPSYGDIIRHLPCLHKFHKQCIDAWLQRKASCPVCKSEIT